MKGECDECDERMQRYWSESDAEASEYLERRTGRRRGTLIVEFFVKNV